MELNKGRKLPACRLAAQKYINYPNDHTNRPSCRPLLDLVEELFTYPHDSQL
jgi:hypothetical protein